MSDTKQDTLNETKEAMKSCENFDDLLTEIELFLRDPYNFTYELIHYLKNGVQLKGEEAIFKITKNMHQTISQLDEYNNRVIIYLFLRSLLIIFKVVFLQESSS